MPGSPAVKDDRPSASAQHVALTRAHLHRLGAVEDPYARGMLRPPWAVADRALRLVPRSRASGSRVLAWLAARTLAIDAAVVAGLDAGITQVATIGAGYDSRPWRLARPGAAFLELDHPATQADKRRRAPAGGPAYAPLVIGETPVGAALATAGWEPRPGALVVEGVLMYLDEPRVASLLADLAAHSPPGSRLVANVGIGFSRHGGGQERWGRRALALGREPFRCELHPDEVPGLLATAGWEPTEILTGPEAAARHLRGTGLALDGVGERSAVVTARRPSAS